MKHFKYLSKTLLFLCLLFAVSAWAHNEPRQVQLQDDEITAILQSEHQYVFIGQEASEMLATLKEIAHLSDNHNELQHIKALLNLAEHNYKTARKDTVLKAFDEVNHILNQHHRKTNDASLQRLVHTCDELIELVATDALTLVATRSADTPDTPAADDDNDRSCNSGSKTFCNITVTGSAKIGTLFVTNNATIGGNLNVRGNATFTGSTNAFIQNGNSFGQDAFLGTNDNFDLNFETAGTTRVNISNTGDMSLTGGNLLLEDQGQLQLQEPGGPSIVALQAPALAASYTLTLPVDAGTAGQGLATDGTGVLSWTSFASAANAFVQDGNSFGTTAVLGTNDVQDLQFETVNTTRMTIGGATNAGNVGIGQAPTTDRLAVSGNITASGIVTGTGTSHALIARNTGNNNLQTRIGYNTVDDHGFLGALDVAGNFKELDLFNPGSTPVGVYGNQNFTAANGFLAGDGVVMFRDVSHTYSLHAAGTQAVGGTQTNKATRMIWAIIQDTGTIIAQSGGITGVTAAGSGVYTVNFATFPSQPVAVGTAFGSAAESVLYITNLTSSQLDLRIRVSGVGTNEYFCLIIMGEES